MEGVFYYGVGLTIEILYFQKNGLVIKGEISNKKVRWGKYFHYEINKMKFITFQTELKEEKEIFTGEIIHGERNGLFEFGESIEIFSYIHNHSNGDFYVKLFTAESELNRFVINVCENKEILFKND